MSDEEVARGQLWHRLAAMHWIHYHIQCKHLRYSHPAYALAELKMKERQKDRQEQGKQNGERKQERRKAPEECKKGRKPRKTERKQDRRKERGKESKKEESKQKGKDSKKRKQARQKSKHSLTVAWSVREQTGNSSFLPKKRMCASARA